MVEIKFGSIFKQISKRVNLNEVSNGIHSTKLDQIAKEFET